MSDKQKNTRKIRLASILSTTPADELKNFIQFYSRHDDAFETIIKAHFINNITDHDNGNKYARILSEIIKPRTLSRPKVKPKDKKTIGVVLRDFLDQMNDLLSMSNYKEAFNIFSGTFDKVLYLIFKYEIKDKSFEDIRVHFLKNLEIILSQDIAPRFRQTIEWRLKDIVLSSYYMPMEYNLVAILHTYNILTESDKSSLINHFISKYKEDRDNRYIDTIVLTAIPIVKLYKEVRLAINEHDIFKSLVNLTYGSHNQEVSFYTAQAFDYHNNLLNAHLAIAQKDIAMLNEVIVTIDYRKAPIDEIKKLVERMSETYIIDNYNQIGKWIEELPFGLRSQLYLKGHKYNKLLKDLEAKKDVQWLKVLDKELYDAGYKDNLIKIYVNLAIEYLESHIGQSSREYMAEIRAHMDRHDMMDMYFAMEGKLVEVFAHRNLT